MPSDLSPEEALGIQEACQAEPAFHVRHVQGFEGLEPHQAELFFLLSDVTRIGIRLIAIKASHGVGKTFSVAKAILAIVPSVPNTKCITTAPTNRQVEQLLWSDIRQGFKTSRFPLGGRMLQVEWKIDDDWFAVGFSPQKEAAGEEHSKGANMQGYHAYLIIIIFDEATGIPKSIWDQVKGMLTNARVIFIAIGNPTDPTSEFAQCFKKSSWLKLSWPCFVSPNLPANGLRNKEDLQREMDILRALPDDQRRARMDGYKVVHDRLVTAQWVLMSAEDCGWDLSHPFMKGRVLSEFPDSDPRSIVSMADVEAAQARVVAPSDAKVALRCLGVDCARFGTDRSVITILDDEIQTLHLSLSQKDTNEVAGEVISILRHADPAERTVVLVDSTGLGAGVFDKLKEAADEKRINAIVLEVQFGASAADPNASSALQEKDKEHYFNLKAKMFDLLARDLRTTIKILNHDVYLKQLPSIRKAYDSKGRLRIESKEDYRKRTGMSSPDDADSLGIANLGRHLVLDEGGDDFRITRI